MSTILETAPAFVAMAHGMVWATLAYDDETPIMVWNLFRNGPPPPVGYDPASVPAWKSSTAEAFAVIQLEPWRLRGFPGAVLLEHLPRDEYAPAAAFVRDTARELGLPL